MFPSRKVDRAVDRGKKGGGPKGTPARPFLREGRRSCPSRRKGKKRKKTDPGFSEYVEKEGKKKRKKASSGNVYSVDRKSPANPVLPGGKKGKRSPAFSA